MSRIAASGPAGKTRAFMGHMLADTHACRRPYSRLPGGRSLCIPVIRLERPAGAALGYDAKGRRSKVLYGAPPDLHNQIEAA